MGEEMKEKKRKDRPEIQVRSISPLGDLTPEIIHKLNMPLASVIGYAELLLPRMTDPEEKKTLEKIREEAKRASEIIKAFVDFIRKENPKKEVVDLNELIEEVSRAKIHTLNLRNISLVKELSPSIPLTLLDSEQIQKALLNLINNAEEAISEFHGFGEIRVKTSIMDGQIEVTVSDDGPGIPKENIS
jgi:signal transduction histidine kinase